MRQFPHEHPGAHRRHAKSYPYSARAGRLPGNICHTE